MFSENVSSDWYWIFTKTVPNGEVMASVQFGNGIDSEKDIHTFDFIINFKTFDFVELSHRKLFITGIINELEECKLFT